jgi:uncharacterized Zn ribbon protein
VGLGEAQGFDFASNIQSEGVWGAASPPKVLPLIFEQFLIGTTIKETYMSTKDSDGVELNNGDNVQVIRDL